MKSYTDIEQSKKLAEILPKESADMWYQYIGDSFKDGITKPIYFPMIMRDDPTEKDIPAWSLSALLDVLENPMLLKRDGLWHLYVDDSISCLNFKNPIDACVEMIIELNKMCAL